MSAEPGRALLRGGRQAIAALLLTLATVAAPSLSLAAPPLKADAASCPVGRSVETQQLPPQAQQTLRLIAQGGPFPYARDGITFGNRERLLPQARRGFYREYTVRTPGVRNRGARRIVCGGRDAVDTSTCYYSDDHYASFRCITP